MAIVIYYIPVEFLTKKALEMLDTVELNGKKYAILELEYDVASGKPLLDGYIFDGFEIPEGFLENLVKLAETEHIIYTN